ncbi:P-loop containing nucleoside triphosphate hydrolase protein [Cryomyces antarcticus]
MSNKPIFVATHPRACSTAFERVFMTRRDILKCVHEPFGDAFYFGPERLSDRYEEDEKTRLESGFSESTFKTVLDRIHRENTEGKRLFIKDITHYLVPPNGKPASIAPSLLSKKRGVGTNGSTPDGDNPSENLTTSAPLVDSAVDISANGASPYPYPTAAEPNNPTVVPEAILEQFHFTFLIRHPRSSIPSYYRCTIPPLDEVTGFYDFMPSEAGYDELRRVFDYLKSVEQVGPAIAGQDSTNGTNSTNGHTSNGTNGVGKKGKVDICVVDADDLLDNPSGIIEAYCKSVGIEYSPEMLKWDNEEDHRCAKEAFEKWKGFHEDAIHSSELKPRLHKKKVKSNEDHYDEWVAKYGQKGAKVIQDTVNANVADYEYLKQFAIKV